MAQNLENILVDVLKSDTLTITSLEKDCTQLAVQFVGSYSDSERFKSDFIGFWASVKTQLFTSENIPLVRTALSKLSDEYNTIEKPQYDHIKRAFNIFAIQDANDNSIYDFDTSFKVILNRTLRTAVIAEVSGLSYANVRELSAKSIDEFLPSIVKTPADSDMVYNMNYAFVDVVSNAYLHPVSKTVPKNKL